MLILKQDNTICEKFNLKVKTFCEGCFYKTKNFWKGPVLGWQVLGRILFKMIKIVKDLLKDLKYS